VAPPAGQDTQAAHLYGLRDLVEFFGQWALGVLIVAAFGGIYLAAGIHESNWINPTTVPAKASVIRSWAVNDQGDSQTYAYVRFKAKSGRVMHTTIEPNILATLARGQKIPVLYNPAKPHEAGYAGPGGDSVYSQSPLFSGPLAFSIAAAIFSLALILLITRLWQLVGIIWADPTAAATPVRLRISHGMAYAEHISRKYGLEWHLLDHPSYPDMVGDAHILGTPAAGRMLIVRLDNGLLVWPASRAQPVLASGKLRLPEVEPGRVGSVQLLLAGYAQIVDLLGALPLVIRRPPGAQTEWWGWFGALRPTVKTLITLHLRRRLDELGGALLREALLCEPDSQSRRTLAQASEECRIFDRTLPRHNLFAVLATITATSMTIVSPFLLLPHIPLSVLVINSFILLFLAGVLIFSVVPLYMFFQSMRYKRALFNPVSGRAGQPVTEPTVSANAGWDVYELECAAFTALAVPQPVEWESRQSIRWLIGAICLVPAAIGLYKLPLPTLIVLAATAAWTVALRINRWRRRFHSL
jgi:hypothetical protein